MLCPKCGNANMEPAHLCQVCGATLPDDPQPAPAAPTPTAVAGTDQPLTGMLYRALLGQIHPDYYLRHFSRFDATGKAALTWHWPAFFCTLGWLVFRRMGLYALGFAAFSVTAGLTLLGVVPLIWGASEALTWGAAAVFFLLVWVLPALLANALYYRHCNRHITDALVLAPDLHEACTHLALRSSTRRHAWWTGTVVALTWLCAGAWALWLVQATYLPTASRATAPAAKPATPAVSSPVPAASETAMLPASAPASAPAAPTPVSEPSAPVTATATAAAAAVPARAEPPARKPSGASPPAPSGHGSFVVAVGVFAQEPNADRAYNKLAAAGLPVHANAVQTPEGQRLMIRVGPYDTRDQARQAAQKVQALELPAVVMRRDGSAGR